MANIDYLPSSKKLNPKKETIDFLLKFSKSHVSLGSRKRRQRFMVCQN